MHRLQGLPSRLHGVERQNGKNRLQLRRLRQSDRSHGRVVHGHAVHRMGQSGEPKSGMAHPQGRLHALRRSGLSEGLSGARRDRPILQRHRRFRPREMHRLRLLHQGMPVQHPAHLEGRSKSLQVHAVLRSGRRRSGAGLRQGLSDARDRVRHQGGDEGSRCRVGSRTCNRAATRTPAFTILPASAGRM